MSAKEIVEQRLKESSQEVPATVFDSGFNSVIDAASKNFLKEGWDATVQKVALMEKVAALQDEDFVAGQQAAIDLLTQLSEDEYLSLIQGETQMSFEFGKEAAYADFVEMAENGAGFTDVVEAVRNTLDQELEKNASEEDIDSKLGVESVCYQFLKVANDLYGEYDMSDLSDEEVLDTVLLKIAEEEEKSRTQKVKDFAGRHKKKLIGAGVAAAALAPGLRGAGGGASLAHLTGQSKAKGAAAGFTGAYKDMGRSAAAGASKLKGKVGSAYNSVKEKMGKKASDERVQEALEILAEAGLLDD
jgi:hypothetical protein